MYKRKDGIIAPCIIDTLRRNRDVVSFAHSV